MAREKQHNNITEPCRGCMKSDGCGLKGHPSDTKTLMLKRVDSLPGKKVFECHSILADEATKPYDSRATRRLQGESGLQY